MKLALLVLTFFGFGACQIQAADDLPWADGIGMKPCRELPSIPEEGLEQWVRGYWTGANLYLGGTDLCLERGRIADVTIKEIRSMLRSFCAGRENHPIMFAALQALKRLPAIEGSRAAACVPAK